MPLKSWLLFPALFALLVALPAAAEGPTSSKGMATMTYEGRAASPKIRSEALKKAKINAIERYFSESSAASLKNYEIVRPTIAASIDDFVLEAVVLSESDDTKSKSYSVAIRADLNVPRLMNAVQGGTAVANAGAAERSLMTFVFVAREQRAVQRFDDKVYKRSDSERKSESSKSSSEAVRATGTTMDEAGNSSASDSNSEQTTTGGSTTQKADAVTWDVTRANEINVAMTGVFAESSFEVVEAEFLESETNGLLSIASFQNDFKAGNDLRAATLRDAAKGAQAVEVPYLAIGTLDVGIRDRDPVSGLQRVYVTVTGKILDVRGRFPKTVSSVGPVQFAGTGPNESVARTNALKVASSAAARELVDQLGAKNVQ